MNESLLPDEYGVRRLPSLMDLQFAPNSLSLCGEPAYDVLQLGDLS